MRLKTVISPAGTFTYSLGATGYDPVTDVSFNGSSHVETIRDDLARVTQQNLYTVQQDPISYGYNAGSLRTQAVFTAGNYINYTLFPGVASWVAASLFTFSYSSYDMSVALTVTDLFLRVFSAEVAIAKM